MKVSSESLPPPPLPPRSPRSHSLISSHISYARLTKNKENLLQPPTSNDKTSSHGSKAHDCVTTNPPPLLPRVRAQSLPSFGAMSRNRAPPGILVPFPGTRPGPVANAGPVIVVLSTTTVVRACVVGTRGHRGGASHAQTTAAHTTELRTAILVEALS